MKHKTGILIDDCYLRHAINGQTIENPERIRTLSGIVRNRYKKNCANPYSYDRDTYLMKDSLVTEKKERPGIYFSERAHQILKDHPARAYWTF